MTSVLFISVVDLIPSRLIRLSPVKHVHRHTGTQLFRFAWGFIPFPLLDIVNKAQRYFLSSVNMVVTFPCSLFLVPSTEFNIVSSFTHACILWQPVLIIILRLTQRINERPSSNPWKRDLIGLTVKSLKSK